VVNDKRSEDWAQLARAALAASREKLRAAARRAGEAQRDLDKAADYVESMVLKGAER
jgi:hypothetical protein